jgi:hypothetical protein
MENIECLELVESLNDETFIDGRCMEHIEPFHFESNGYQCKISFMGVDLISTDNDEREWIGDEPEPLRDFIIKEAKKVLLDITVRMQQI